MSKRYVRMIESWGEQKSLKHHVFAVQTIQVLISLNLPCRVRRKNALLHTSCRVTQNAKASQLQLEDTFIAPWAEILVSCSTFEVSSKVTATNTHQPTITGAALRRWVHRRPSWSTTTRRFRWILVGAPSLPFRKRSARSWNCRLCRLMIGWLWKVLTCEKQDIYGYFMNGWFIIMYY